MQSGRESPQFSTVASTVEERLLSLMFVFIRGNMGA